MTGNVRAFQIFHDEATRAGLEPDFEPLDDSASARPDWREYWPMRSYLGAHELAETAYYGFLSPDLRSKTGLSGRQVLDFARTAGDADVVTFSPQPCHGAAFYNVFEQGANFFPGFLDLATEFLRSVNPDFSLQWLVNDSRNTVYGNYFLARPRFWREWRALFERVFELAETPGSPLHEALNRPARADGPQMKVVLVERIPSLLLSSRAFKTRNYPPFSLPLSAAFAGLRPELVTLDALKIAFADTGEQHFLKQFSARRAPVLNTALPRLGL